MIPPLVYVCVQSLLLTKSYSYGVRGNFLGPSGSVVARIQEQCKPDREHWFWGQLWLFELDTTFVI